MSLFLDSISESRKIQLVTASGIGNRPVHVVGNNFYTINNQNYPVISSDGGISWTNLTSRAPLNLQLASIGHSNLDIFYKNSLLNSNNVFTLSELSRAAALNIAPVKISNWSGNSFSSYSFRRFIYDGNFIAGLSQTPAPESAAFKQIQTGSKSGYLQGNPPLDILTKSLGVVGGLITQTTFESAGGFIKISTGEFDLLTYKLSNVITTIRLSQATDGVERRIYPWTLCEADTSSSDGRGLACVFASDFNGLNRGIYRIFKDNVPGGLVQGALEERPRIEFIPSNYPVEFINQGLASSFKITEDGKIYVVYNTGIPFSSVSRWFSQSFGSDWIQLPNLTNASHFITSPVEDSFKISANGINQIIRTNLGLYISTNYGY